jgi:ribonuclease Z
VPEVIVLGTAASVPDAKHDTVSLAVCGSGWAVLVDCGGSPLHKLARAGIGPEAIRAVILTHRHADHLYGLPMLVQGLWLSQRQAALPIYGPAETLRVARSLLRLFTLDERSEMFPLNWHPVPLRQGRAVLDVGVVRISSTPVEHGEVEALGLRIENLESGRVIVYSADTEPCPAMVQLALGADLLIHEATGEHMGHSSPAQAAEIGRQAGACQLALIHYPVRDVNLEAWRRAASEFPGPVILSQDGDRYAL